MLQSSVFRLRRASQPPRRMARFLQSRPGSYLVLGLLLSGGLGGCKFDDDSMAAYKNSKAYRSRHPVDVDVLPTVGPRLNDQPNMVTGRMTPHAAPPAAPALGTPEPINNEIALDESARSLSEGERQAGWRGMADIYWKLNWMRSELLSSNVPRNLHEFILRTRKHIERISHEYPAEPGMEKYIEPATKALQHIEAGWDHFQQSIALENANVHWLSIPWGTGEEQVKNYFEHQGLATPERAKSLSAYGSHADDDEGRSPDVRRTSAVLPISPQQQQAVEMALRYERVYHGSPDSVARQEFGEGMREIVRLAELFKFTYRPPSVPGTVATIVTPLHQEASSIEPSKPPVSPTDAPLPNSAIKSEPSNPFHVDGPLIR